MPKSRRRRERRFRPSMPLLPRRLPMPKFEIDHALAWRVAHCYRSSVVRIRDRLKEMDIATYLPMEAFERIKRNRRIRDERPALSGYLFVGLNAARPDYLAVEDAVRGGWGLPVEGRLLRNAEGVPLHVPPIALERLAEALYVPEVPAEVILRARFSAGSFVTPLVGPWERFIGEVERSDDDTVRVLLQLFGRKTAVEFNPEHLEAVG
jgi:transcription antitermination factor NusG